MINMAREKDFGEGVTKVGRRFFVYVGSGGQVTHEQQRIMLREQDIFAGALTYTVVTRNSVTSTAVVYAPYTPPRKIKPARCDFNV